MSIQKDRISAADIPASQASALRQHIGMSLNPP